MWDFELYILVSVSGTIKRAQTPAQVLLKYYKVFTQKKKSTYYILVGTRTYHVFKNTNLYIFYYVEKFSTSQKIFADLIVLELFFYKSFSIYSYYSSHNVTLMTSEN